MREKPMFSWGIVYHCLRTVNLNRIAPKHFRLEFIQCMAGVKKVASFPGLAQFSVASARGEPGNEAIKKVRTSIKHSSLFFEKVDFTLKAE